MSNIINLLIVDDHPFIIEGYKHGINAYKSKEEYKFNISQAKNCETGYEAIMNAEVPFDVVFLDLNMPAYEEKNILSGEDLALLIQKQMPDARLIMLTMTNDMEKVLSLIDTVNPNGLAIKNDLGHKELLLGFDKVMKNLYYYSDSVVKLLSKPQYEGYDFDQFDKEILTQISKGIKPRYLLKYVPLTSEVVINRRKNLFKVLGVKTDLDQDLLDKARKKGLL